MNGKGSLMTHLSRGLEEYYYLCLDAGEEEYCQDKAISSSLLTGLDYLFLAVKSSPQGTKWIAGSK